jgi:hypothetical protein
LGLKHFLVDSTGVTGNKAHLKIARIQEKIKNARHNFSQGLHQAGLREPSGLLGGSVCEEHGKNHRLAKSITDLSGPSSSPCHGV